MPLVISNDGARHEFDLAGSVFLYTPCGWGELLEIRKAKRDKDTLRVEEGEVEVEVLKRHLVGWKKRAVVDPDGKRVPFSHAALLSLPPGVVETLVLKILAGVREEEKQQGNSDGSSNT